MLREPLKEFSPKPRPTPAEQLGKGGANAKGRTETNLSAPACQFNCQNYQPALVFCNVLPMH
jgi:hypothetical protein